MSQPHRKPSQHARRRRSVRTPVPPLQASLWYANRSPSEALGGVMRNIGAGGVLISAASPMTVGETVHCSFALPGGEIFSLGGSVVRCDNLGDGFDVAVAFAASQSNEKQLMRWIFAWIAMQERALLKEALTSPKTRR